MHYMTKSMTPSRSKLILTAALSGVVLTLAPASVTAHFPTVQGTTAVDPNHGTPGSSVNLSASGAQQGSQYSAMFADPSQVSSFEQGGGSSGHKEACAHGSPIGGPYTADAKGTINPVSVTLPPSSPGRALICFQNPNSLTKPADFTVEGGGMFMPPR